MAVAQPLHTGVAPLPSNYVAVTQPLHTQVALPVTIYMRMYMFMCTSVCFSVHLISLAAAALAQTLFRWLRELG